MSSVALPFVSTSRLWRVAQLAGVLSTVALLGALLAWPKQSLHVLWDMVIPLLPATFLLNPLIWRNVCPLATLNAWTGKRIGQRAMRAGGLRGWWAVGLVLLAVLVPARRFLFNTNGAALAVVVTAVAILALTMGVIYPGRAGFCNAVCPVLSVEKLYGQAPLLSLGNARCAECTVCTPIGCIDLAFTKTVAQTVGPPRRQAGWVTTPFGAFAAAFPGFIVGYFTTANGAVSSAGAVYGHIALAALLSYVIVAGLAVPIRLPGRTAIAALGCFSIALYYWYAAPSLGAAYGAPSIGPAVVRVLAFALLLLWLWHAVRRRDAGPRPVRIEPRR